MAKKNSTKDTEQSLSLFGKIRAIFKNETIHFVIGLVLVIFSVYLLLAFSSFFFTGAAVKVSLIRVMHRNWLLPIMG